MYPLLKYTGKIKMYSLETVDGVHAIVLKKLIGVTKGFCCENTGQLGAYLVKFKFQSPTPTFLPTPLFFSLVLG